MLGLLGRLALVAVAAGWLAACATRPQEPPALVDLSRKLTEALPPETGATVASLPGRVRVSFAAETLFPADSAQLTVDSRATLRRIVPLLKPLHTTRIVVEAYEPTPGGAVLAAQRADGVARYLYAQGADPNLLSAEALDHNATPAPEVDVTLAGDGT